MTRAIRLLAVASLIGALAALVYSQNPVPNPLIATSDIEPQGEFTVSLTFQRTTQPVCFEVPAGHYSQVWTLIAPFEDVQARGFLNLYRQNANAVAPTTKGLQISQRLELFRLGAGGDMWRASLTSFDGPTTLCAVAGGSPESVGMVWLTKLEGRL